MRGEQRCRRKRLEQCSSIRTEVSGARGRTDDEQRQNYFFSGVELQTRTKTIDQQQQNNAKRASRSRQKAAGAAGEDGIWLLWRKRL